MSPRGTSIGARASSRRGVAFFWAALFIASIGLQYAQLSKPSPVDAASGLLADTVAGFEIDGNLKGNDASTNPGGITPASLINNPPMANGKDWLDPNGVADPGGTSTPSTFLFEDATGSGDHSAYAGGNKEDDTRDWDYINAAGPNDKTDFKHIMAHAEVIGNSAFAFLGAERIVNNGTMVVDFELNKKTFKVYPSPAGNNVPKPDRTNGDLLISLEYSNGGSNPIVTIYAIANVQNFPSGQTNDFVKVSDAKTIDAVRSATNFVDLPDQGFGYPIPSFDFAEASIDLAKLGITSACPGFSTGHIRSRTGGDPGSSQLKDVARPFDIDLNNCGKVTIIKNAVPNDPQDFSFTGAGGAPLTGDFKLDNDGDNNNTLSNTKTFELVPPGNYTVTEAPTDRWKLTGLTCVEDKVDNSTGNINTGVASIDVQPNENVTCTYTNTKQKNNPTIVTSANQTGVVVGTNISDSATLSGGFSPTGTITFRAYGPNNPTCAGTAAFTSDPVTVNGNGTYGPVTYAAQGVGTYLWIATYSGDDENNAVAGTCGDAGETDTTIKDTPTISTVASANITIGGTISDTATLADGFKPTGTITFKLYGPNDTNCATVISTTTKTVNGNGAYTSDPFTPSATGTYRWVASYGGDANNIAVSGACNDANESVVVGPAAPGIATSAAEPGVVIANAVHDTAVLSGAVNPTGSITFNLYGPNDATCTGSVAFTTSLPVTANGSYGPVQFVPTAVGTYRWIASYSGDGNNSPITGLCNDAGENDTVIPASPAIVTTANQSVVVGNPISDTATLSNGVSPTGTITFNAYSTADCSGTAAFTTSLPVAGNGPYGPVGFTPSTVGTYHWIASYGGDAKNNPIAGACGDAGENDTVTPAVPAISTSANETSVVIGGDIHDTATLSGGVAPTGTITFNAYSTADCSGTAAFTTSLPVIGNGTYGPVGFTPLAVGTYHWIASYSGDTNNGPIAGACGDPGENDTVIKASPGIVTSADESAVVIGGSVSDSATLSGGVSPTGTIVFNAYSTADCSGTVAFTASVTVNGNGSYGPVSFVPTAVGTYHWIASYGGDAKNNPIAGACGDAGENDTVIPASPTIATVATDGGVAGDQISDTAALSGAHLPTTGTVTFNLYGRLDPTCLSAPIFTSTVPIGADGTATSAPFTAALAGNYHWIASYSGDTNNDPVAGTCGDENESTSIRAFNPVITTSLTSGNLNGPKITVLFGSSVTDQATLTGASATAGGTVTYTVYSDATCSTVFADAGTKDVVNGIVGVSDPVTFPNAGTFYWQATYSGDINNATDTSDCADEVLTVTTPDINVLKLVKTNDGTFAPTSTANPGDTLTFQITVSNTGDADATQIPVSDDINPVLAHATYNGDCSNSCINTAGVLAWTIDIPAGGQVVLTYSVTLSDTFPEGTTHLPNVVIVTGPGSNCAAASEDVDCDTDTTVEAAPALNVLKLVKTNDGSFAPTGTAEPGDTLTYQITINNTGDADATDIPVSDDINPVLAHATYNNDCSNSCNNTAGVLDWTITVPAGGQVILTFSVKLDDVFPVGTTTHLPNVVVVTGPGSNCPTASEDPDCATDTTVKTPDLNVVKLVKTNNGTFAGTSTANPGDKLTFQITVSNTGDGDAKDIPVSDDINPVLAHATYNGDCSNSCSNTAGVLGWTLNIPAGGQVVLTFSVTLSNTFPLGTTHLPNVVVVTGPGSNCAAESEDADCDTDTTVSQSSLLIDKSNDAPLKHIELPPPAGAVDLPTAPEGSTVTFTLNYTFSGDPVTNGIITDVLPVGLTYVAGSATDSSEFHFVSYTTATRTLLWTAENVDASGTVTYKAKVDIGAAKLAQPLTNVATIDSDQTQPDSDTSDVFVPAPPKAETGPPTDIEAPTTTGTPGSSLPLILAILAVIFFTVALVTPVPASARRRNRQR